MERHQSIQIMSEKENEIYSQYAYIEVTGLGAISCGSGYRRITNNNRSHNGALNWMQQKEKQNKN